MAFEVKAIITDEARRRTAEVAASGKSYKVVTFALGNQGHDPNDPTIALTPDPTLEQCQGTFFGPKPVSSVSFANDSCPIWDCFLDFGEAVAQASSICLIAQVVYSPIPNDPELNTTFLYAVANFPLEAKTDLKTKTYKVGVQR